MEPRLFSHGNDTITFITLAIALKLQWSHDFSVMETERIGRRDANRRHASMEPRLFSHGNCTGIGVPQQNDVMLQWSHDFSVMETAIYTTSSKDSSAGSIQTSFGYKK